MNTSKASNYYLGKTNRILKDFRKMHRAAQAVLDQKYTEIDPSFFYKKSKVQLLRLLHELPYIGGDQNGQTINLIMGAIALAIIVTLKEYGLQRDQIGEILYLSFEGYFNSNPRIVKRIYSKLILSKLFIKRMEKEIQQSKLRRYKEDFVLQDRDAKGKKIHLGYNYIECAIHKFYKKHSVVEYLPYLCLGDYALFHAYGIGFQRTQTIGNGGSYCDFRFIKNGPLTKGWPPEELEEWNNSH